MHCSHFAGPQKKFGSQLVGIQSQEEAHAASLLSCLLDLTPCHVLQATLKPSQEAWELCQPV